MCAGSGRWWAVGAGSVRRRSGGGEGRGVRALLAEEEEEEEGGGWNGFALAAVGLEAVVAVVRSFGKWAAQRNRVRARARVA